MKTKLTTTPSAVLFVTDAVAHKYLGQPGKSGTLRVTINLADILSELGGKALHNSTGRSRALKGSVVVVASRIKDVPA